MNSGLRPYEQKQRLMMAQGEQLLVRERHLDGEAGRVPAAGAGAVHSRLEGCCTRALRCQGEVMVYPLAPLHQQMGQSGVQGDVVIVCVQHLLGHQSDLEKTIHKTSVLKCGTLSFSFIGFFM